MQVAASSEKFTKPLGIMYWNHGAPVIRGQRQDSEPNFSAGAP